MPTLTNISLKRQIKTGENGSKIFGDATSAGGFIAIFKKGSDSAGGALTLEGALSAGNSATDNHSFRGTVTFGTGTTIVINDSGNITIGGNITGDTNGDVKIDNTATLKLSVRTTPATTNIGQIFVDSADNNRLKYYDGSVYQTVQTGGTLTFNAIRQNLKVTSATAGRTDITLSATPIGANATERNDMVKVYLNGIYLEENKTTSSDAVTGGGTANWSFTISGLPAGESITAYSLTFEIPYGAGIIKGKDNGAGSIVDNGSTGGTTITSGTVNYATGAVSITLSAAATPTGNASSTFSIADYYYTDATTSVSVFGTIVNDKVFVWYLVP